MLALESLLLIALLAIVLSPLSLEQGSVPQLDGRIASVDNWEELQHMPLPQRLVYLIGDVNCHQMADRSYFLNGNQLPVCARDLGILTGLVSGLAAFMLIRAPLRWGLLLLLLVPMAGDGLLQAIGPYESSNAMRTVTGALAGTGLGYGLGMIVERYFSRAEGPEERGRERASSDLERR
jgi:uncharacterized membrane protein